MAEQVLVIGAGPAGLASAYYLQQAGISYKVVDKAPVIGSTWAMLYPSLRLNTTRFFSHLPGMRFPLWWGFFPTGKQYHSHLVAFAQKHALNIHLGIEVYHITPDGDQGWRVETSTGTDCYPAVILATGRFDYPQYPQIDGLDDFDGPVVHAHDFHDPASFADKRTLVIGCGPSGTDIALAIGELGGPPPLLTIRTGLDLRPRYPFGLPQHAWMLIAEHLPRTWGIKLLNVVGRQRIKGVHELGLKPDAPGAVSTVRGTSMIRAIRQGTVRVVEGPTRFGPDWVEVANGTRYVIDAVILATGYAPALYRFIDLNVEKDANGWPLRDCSHHSDGREILGYPGLYLVGVFYKGKGALFNCNVEAQIAVWQIQERLAHLSMSLTPP